MIETFDLASVSRGFTCARAVTAPDSRGGGAAGSHYRGPRGDVLSLENTLCHGVSGFPAWDAFFHLPGTSPSFNISLEATSCVTISLSKRESSLSLNLPCIFKKNPSYGPRACNLVSSLSVISSLTIPCIIICLLSEYLLSELITR